MLADYPVDVVLLARDVEASKDFYANKVGLKILNATSDRVRFQCGGDSHLVISESTVGTQDDQTQAVFRERPARRSGRTPPPGCQDRGL